MTNKILIVDDEPDLEVLMRQRFRRALRDGQYEFLFARNGIEALQTLRDNRDIGVVLTDINMPQMDGLTLLSELAKFNREKGNLAKAVVVSAYSDMANIRTAMNHGAFDFITKPIDFADVEITIEKTLEYVAQLRQSQRAEEYRIAKETAEDNFARLQELEQWRDSMVHMIVHDLRTPLTAVIGSLQLLNMPDTGTLNEVQTGVVRISLNSAQLLRDLIDDVLNISKMESGTLTLAVSEISAPEIARKSLYQVRSLAANKDIELSDSIAPALPLLRADVELLGRVLVNLLGNALKFTPVGGRVALSIAPGESEIVFSVSDTGVGIAPADFARIFDKFGQVERPESRRTSTGLGLTFCKLVVEAHGGRIWIESTLGEGSTFRFALPVGATNGARPGE